jgi:phosphotriesterase-related protein
VKRALAGGGEVGTVQTVLGPVDAASLGVTQVHEHLLVDLAGDAGSPGTSAAELARWDEPIRLDNYADVCRNEHLYRDNLVLASVDDAVEELAAFRAAGGGCVVDATCADLGRDPLGLARVAAAAGVRVVMGCGHYTSAYHPPWVAGADEAAVCAALVADACEGADGTGVRAGIIGEIGLDWPVHPDEAKVLRAAVRAQRETGLALLVHPGRHPTAPLDAVGRVEAAGGDPGRLVVCHVDRTLFSERDLVQLARTGCWVAFDLFGQELSFYALAPDVDMPNDATRVRRLVALIAAGHGGQLLVSQDICVKARLRRYGGEGYDHLLRNVVPLMRRRGMTETGIEQLLIDNPARVLARQ